MTKFFAYLQVILLILVIARLIIEFINYRKAPFNIKQQMSYKGYPFLIITTALFAGLALFEFLLRTKFLL